MNINIYVRPGVHTGTKWFLIFWITDLFET